jgi:hypothetical protein
MLSLAPLITAAADVSEDGVNIVQSSAEPGRSSALLILFAFLVTWLFIRTSARLIRMQVSWWPGNVETSSGLHIHHLVWGILLIMVSGFLAFATNLVSPWWEITSVAFGIGMGLTLDEYALWLHLEDVYWAEEGRSSIDAVVVFFIFAGLIALGLRPLGLTDSDSLTATLIYGGLGLVFAAITFLKGRLFLGVVAFFIPFVGIYCACRLAKPHSIWARTRYKSTKSRTRRRMERAEHRWRADRRTKRIGLQLEDWIGGRPTEELPPAEQAKDAPLAASAAAADAHDEHHDDPASQPR